MLNIQTRVLFVTLAFINPKVIAWNLCQQFASAGASVLGTIAQYDSDWQRDGICVVFIIATKSDKHKRHDDVLEWNSRFLPIHFTFGN